MKFIYYLIAIFAVLAGIVLSTGWFNDSHEQSEIDIVMMSVKNSAINAVDAVTEGAADAVNAVDEMGDVGEQTLEEVAEEVGEE